MHEIILDSNNPHPIQEDTTYLTKISGTKVHIKKLSNLLNNKFSKCEFILNFEGNYNSDNPPSIDLADSKINDCSFTNSNDNKCRLITLSRSNALNCNFGNYVGDLYTSELTKCNFSYPKKAPDKKLDNNLRGRIDNTKFTLCNFAERKLGGSIYCDVEFNYCNFIGVDFNETEYFCDFKLQNCILIGAENMPDGFKSGLVDELPGFLDEWRVDEQGDPQEHIKISNNIFTSTQLVERILADDFNPSSDQGKMFIEGAKYLAQNPQHLLKDESMDYTLQSDSDYEGLDVAQKAIQAKQNNEANQKTLENLKFFEAIDACFRLKEVRESGCSYAGIFTKGNLTKTEESVEPPTKKLKTKTSA